VTWMREEFPECPLAADDAMVTVWVMLRLGCTS
jgi:hypothetical protein